ncbi:protein disulfide oxidoreductase [Ignicoccus hospitalis]|uniref:Glutaredoxin-like domain protein n=1 Tax=Ignicoccus hospitalis (strain KIN4/I / DSM 18386 / JCM 14125) TaxID=453591 RepID=A8AAY4_IGNH4|nr:thioredoxin family protein [Ignicoccus hospitalis]ABU82086.1 glutaredoxin-like domain protein [Ignicoccus hospitalis KIN4/I]HIH91044.1 glutaredoxin [Desulfurococcaceae archaeon]
MSFGMEWTPEARAGLREALADMKGPVEALVFVEEGCEPCEATIEMMQVMKEESPKVNGKPYFDYKVFWRGKDDEAFDKYKVDRVPSVLLLDGYIRYTGIPAGEEVKGFVETVIRISENESGLDEETKEGLKKLKGCYYIENVVTPQCPYCPYAALLINMFAFEAKKQGNPCVVADTVEAYENEDIADKYNVMSVPAIAINGNVEFVGVPYEDDLLAKLFEVEPKGPCEDEVCFVRP